MSSTSFKANVSCKPTLRSTSADVVPTRSRDSA